MSLKRHNLKPAGGSKKNKKRIGRGNASGSGTYSGRGLKGQRSRSGGKKGLQYKGFKRQLEQIPKKRGFTSRHIRVESVNLKDLDGMYQAGEEVTLRSLRSRGLVGRTRGNVKILGVGSLDKKLVFSGLTYSALAKRKIEESGGEIVPESKKSKNQ